MLREGRIGARLQHVNVITMFDLVVENDRPWLVMEYLPSDSLATRLALHGPLPVAEVAEIGRQMADGLAAAHSAGVVHRDVKPGNVLIAANGLVKLTDFGVSRAVDDVQLTRTGVIAGTPAYLAPEVAQGQDPTAASDVFALGATLYAAVEGTTAVRARRQRLCPAAQGRDGRARTTPAGRSAGRDPHAAAERRPGEAPIRRCRRGTCSPPSRSVTPSTPSGPDRDVADRGRADGG